MKAICTKLQRIYKVSVIFQFFQSFCFSSSIVNARKPGSRKRWNEASPRHNPKKIISWIIPKKHFSSFLFFDFFRAGFLNLGYLSLRGWANSSRGEQIIIVWHKNKQVNRSKREYLNQNIILFFSSREHVPGKLNLEWLSLTITGIDWLIESFM